MINAKCINIDSSLNEYNILLLMNCFVSIFRQLIEMSYHRKVHKTSKF